MIIGVPVSRFAARPTAPFRRNPIGSFILTAIIGVAVGTAIGFVGRDVKMAPSSAPAVHHSGMLLPAIDTTSPARLNPAPVLSKRDVSKVGVTSQSQLADLRTPVAHTASPRVAKIESASHTAYVEQTTARAEALNLRTLALREPLRSDAHDETPIIPAVPRSVEATREPGMIDSQILMPKIDTSQSHERENLERTERLDALDALRALRQH